MLNPFPAWQSCVRVGAKLSWVSGTQSCEVASECLATERPYECLWLTSHPQKARLSKSLRAGFSIRATPQSAKESRF